LPVQECDEEDCRGEDEGKVETSLKRRNTVNRDSLPFPLPRIWRSLSAGILRRSVGLDPVLIFWILSPRSFIPVFWNMSSLGKMDRYRVFQKL